MKLLHVSEDILPIADFKAHASEVVRGPAPQSSKPAAVLLSPREFDQLTQRARFLTAVDEGLADARAGRVLSDEELGRTLDE